jgi:flagellar basal body rod protein FlgG
MEKKISEIRDDVISVKYKGKLVTINITKELSIDENIINSQLKNIPSSYAFLCLLRDNLIKKRDTLEREKNIAYSKAWLFYKESDNRLNNDTANHKAMVNPKYLSIEERYLKAVHKANKLISICRAYESRERIIQTLSANIRKQS